ncbi:MAG: hypothetical protein WKF92_16160 [Pyrinomonadaceae bacterium]
MTCKINKTSFTSLALSVAFLALFTMSASAQNDQKGGAAGLVAAVVQIATDDTLQNNGTVDLRVIQLDRSLNNLKALNNVLNNSPILSKNNVDITVQDIQALNDNTVLTDFLKNNNIAIGEVVGVSVLSGGDIIVFRQGKTKK